MNLEQTWQNIGKSAEIGIYDLSASKNGEMFDSLSPLRKLKKSLTYSIAWALLITLFYLGGLFVFPLLAVQICLCLCIAYNVVSCIQTWRLQTAINQDVNPQNPLKIELERNYHSLIQWSRLQQRNAIFVYPVSITGGFIAGISLNGAGHIDSLMHKPALWVILLIAMVILVPLCYALSRKMMNIAYGKQLFYLKTTIESLHQD